ncbi:MAG: FtsJ-like methyltransferase [Edafosvirus sp.]|uniref:FtsJ-like methyltransferase n=1 Tax=Edafosvirus sp. TaxID=2487765 RepID=A0A3G4ZV34_9VIRU|nr:MAG: FtsJ-like methyltransferase [Edafosvirus sp.]
MPPKKDKPKSAPKKKESKKEDKKEDKKESKKEDKKVISQNTPPAVQPLVPTAITKGEKHRVPEDYVPISVQMPSLKSKDKSDNIFAHDATPKFSNNIDYPRFSLGFHHFIHANKDKMEILKEFEGKKKVYQVMNRFERYVDNYDADINNVSKVYFDLDPKPDILSRGFFKLWEILFMFNLIPLDQSNFVSAHLAEGPGSFIQATMFYRDKFTKDKATSKNDKYYAITLHPEDSDKHVPELEGSFVEYYNNEKPKRFMLHKTYNKQTAGGSIDKDNGDLTNPKTFKLFGGQIMQEKPIFITADGGFDWVNENTQEQEAFRLIFAQILTAVKIQGEGGSFVCKFFESFTMTTAKFMYILNSFYDKVYMVKPLMSRASNSEKYAICLNYKFGEKDKTKNQMIEKLEEILNKAHENKDLKLIDIFPDFNIPPDYLTHLIYLNTTIANKQLIAINEIVSFIQAQNYYGDTYQQRRNMQIDASKYWVSSFYPEKTDHNKIMTVQKNITNDSISYAEEKIQKLEKKLDFTM